MSRIGKAAIKYSKDVTVLIEDGGIYNNKYVTVKGPKGEMSLDVRRGLNINANTEIFEVLVERTSEAKSIKALHGLYRTLIRNMVSGVVTGYKKELEVHGVGFRAKSVGTGVELTLGWTHPVRFEAPKGITISVPSETEIIVEGIDKQLVGEVAAKIRGIRKPEPYKGKGIRYKGEYVKRKVGKTSAK